jgi:hypothetical protein
VIARLARFSLLALAFVVPMPATAQEASESAVKAALLYKFASYVEWPVDAFPSAAAPLVIAAMGADDVATELEQLAKGRSVNNRPIQVRRVGDGESLAGSHIVFVGQREAARIGTLARLARPLFILLVSDASQGLENGSVINFVSIGDRLGFEVSIDAAEQSSLRISSRMLAVARRVVAKS